MKEKRTLFRILATGLIVGIIAAAASTILVSLKKTSYEAVTTWTISKTQSLNQDNVGYYLYDQYYIALASEQYSDTVLSWAASPGIVESVYQKAGVHLPATKPTKVGKLIKVTKRPPANLAMRFQASSADEAQRLAAAAHTVFTQRLQEVTHSSTVSEPYTIVASPIFSSVNTLNPMLIGLSAFVAAWLAVVILWGTVLYIIKG